ncbi:hypothetical protein BCV69DRAFT_27638 [Microstroma glucosiphilum]|uniref:Uncharacterized protein n=1 Tax=Pseudomicrostroma glucosiphilum TaxID=1684307 RepID=A0A316U2W5_9BASI|nr:hypothetical protein BCV69DRAFT_27638 [Pseudomicrostroma glucosiphilum]PWN19659.1 hypothetical protein BCV69DRAFT_27638 [Pseudomicrostroma glucosiphilum]
MQAHRVFSESISRLIWACLLFFALVSMNAPYLVRAGRVVPRARLTDLTEHASPSGTKPGITSWSSSSSAASSPSSSPKRPNQIPLGKPSGKVTSSITKIPPGTGAWTSDPTLADKVFRTNSAQFRDMMTHGIAMTPVRTAPVSKKGKEIIQGPPPPSSPPMTWKQRQQMMSAAAAAAARRPVLPLEQLKKQRNPRGPASGTRNRVIADCAQSVGSGVGSLWRAIAGCFKGSGKRKLGRRYQAVARQWSP